MVDGLAEPGRGGGDARGQDGRQQDADGEDRVRRGNR
jgi:hypothetical protein